MLGRSDSLKRHGARDTHDDSCPIHDHCAAQTPDALLARLRNGEDFATLAKKESQGPTASAGGKWETTPGSYGVPSVNDALNRLGVNQLSPIIEAPSSFHIVLVELRRPAGPGRGMGAFLRCRRGIDIAGYVMTK